ncbi:hypothetical protein GCM10009117_12550 [Gangjinia marincola]|uniref:Uncharacterized protein n=1 Tax=Gangjinia marincola TaxID=578463 RepID=A0ABP3XV36_9FLAO
MALTDFFRVNLPYGMKKNEDGEWFTFNREYIPLGWNKENFSKNDSFESLPVYTKYRGLTNSFIEKIIESDRNIKRDINGDINMFFFYEDKTNPRNDSSKWIEYFDKVKAFSKLKVKS